MTTPFSFEAPPGVWAGPRIKAGFHCHTIRSDGGLTPERTVERYRALEYQCLGITDHRLVTRLESTPDPAMLVIPATENGGDPDIIGVGVETPVDSGLSLPELAAGLARQGGFTIAAHPAYCGVLPEAYVACPDLMAMEIYNAYCDDAYANGTALELWDMVLGRGKRIWGVAGDDAHLNPRKRRYSDAGRGWVEIWAAAFTADAVLRALKQGSFFSSQGPVFEELTVEGATIRLRCSPVRQIRWRTWGSVGHVEHAAPEGALTQGRLPAWFQPSGFVRIELVDGAGKRAWSNPIFLKGSPC